MDNWTRYIPHDGDQIKIIFGPETSFVQLDDRTVIDESEATRTLDIDITGDEASTRFNPGAPTINVNETVKVIVHNKGTLSHQMRIAGDDGKFDTGDDYVAVPAGSDAKTNDKGDVLQPGQDGFVVVRFSGTKPQIPFEDPTASSAGNAGNTTTNSFATGNFIVEGASGTTTPTPGPGGTADVKVDLTLNDSAYDPPTLTIAGAADKTFGITLTNKGTFVHNLQIAGPDGQFGTDDDITSDDVPPLAATPTASPTPTPTAVPSGTIASSAGVTASPTPAATPVPVNVTTVVGKLAGGTYKYRDSFHPEITGTIIIN
jgi:hypothetical protein